MVGDRAAPETEPALYRLSVPVLLGVLERIGASLARAEAMLGPAFDEALAMRPASGMLPAARQAATAMQFTLRTSYPLAGQKVPEPRAGHDAPGLAERLGETRRRLEALDPRDFAGAETRLARDQAGFAIVELPGEAFLHRFGLPNVYFHQAMAHVALKQAGAALRKADFDGIHSYPDGFSFG